MEKSRKIKPVEFLRNAKTQDYMRALEKVGNPTFKKTAGRNGGTWGCKLLAYDYAGWIDPDFKVGVYTILDQYFSGNLQAASPLERMNDLVVRDRISRAKGAEAAKSLNARKQEKLLLSIEAEELLNEFQLMLPMEVKLGKGK